MTPQEMERRRQLLRDQTPMFSMPSIMNMFGGGGGAPMETRPEVLQQMRNQMTPTTPDRKNFSGLISERSPALPQLSNWYMQGQLQKYKQNILGYKVEDSDGYSMSSLMKDYSNQQIADMVSYIKTFKPRKQLNMLHGDLENGKIEYQLNCMACHQENGKGNKQLHAPNLVGLSDVYIVNQLIKYKDGIRGSGNGDKHGKVMQLFAKNLKNETVMKDIASYIISLQE